MILMIDNYDSFTYNLVQYLRELGAAVAATFFIVLAWNIFGDRLRDALDPKLKNV